MLVLITHTSCTILRAVVLLPLPMFLCTVVLPVKSQSCALGIAAEVSSPHLVLYRYVLHPSDLRYVSVGKKAPHAKAARGGISVLCAKYFSGKYEEEVHGKYISSLLNYRTHAGCS